MRIILLSVLLLFIPFWADAFDFEVNGIYYNIISKEAKTCEVTYRDQISSHYYGDVILKEEAKYQGVTYKVTRIKSNAFYGQNRLSSIIIPNSISTIGEYAFYECLALKSITFPDNLEMIGQYAFYYCNQLKTVKLPNSVKSIGCFAFGQCERLEEITIPNSLQTIEHGTFYNCYALTSVELPNSMTTIGARSFSGCKNLVSVSMPQRLESIGESAFEETKIEAVILPSTVEIIENGAFSICKDLKSIILPITMKAIGSRAFSGCKSLETIEIPENVITLESYVLGGCTNLQKVKIPSSITSIDKTAFINTDNISQIISFIQEPFDIDEECFSDKVYNSAVLTIPFGKKDVYKQAQGWKNFIHVVNNDIPSSIMKNDIYPKLIHKSYSPNGKTQNGITKGVNIVISKGKTRKLLVK